jgi:hypothetical protein
MNRPLFRPSLDPTLEEFLGFLGWLVVVIVSMIAMIRVPAFNLLFWPTLWIYDLATAEGPRNSLDLEEEPRPRPSKVSHSLWDREFDG